MRRGGGLIGGGVLTLLLIAGCGGGEEGGGEAAAEPELRRTDAFRFAGLFDPGPMEILDCGDQTPFPVREGPEVATLIDLHQELSPGLEPVEYIFVDLLVVGMEQGREGWLDVREMYRAGNEGIGCPEPGDPPPTALFSAQGNEPFWGVEVGTDSLRWSRPGAPDARVAHQGVSGRLAIGWEVEAEVDGAPLHLRIDPEPCRDTMSGTFFHLSATLVVRGEEWVGCAWQPTGVAG